MKIFTIGVGTIFPYLEKIESFNMRWQNKKFMIFGFTILNSFQHVLQTSLIKKTIRKLHLFSQMLFTLEKKLQKRCVENWLVKLNSQAISWKSSEEFFELFDCGKKPQSNHNKFKKNQVVELKVHKIYFLVSPRLCLCNECLILHVD